MEETTKEKIFDVILAALYFVVAGATAIGVIVTAMVCSQNLHVGPD